MDTSVSTRLTQHDAVAVNNMLFTGLAGRAEADNAFVKNCICLAQLKADSAFDSNTRPAEWFDYFAGILWSFGWSLDEPPRVLVQPDFSGSVQEAWRRLAAPLLTRTQLTQVEAGLRALESDAVLLQQFSGLGGKTFKSHILPVSQDASGDWVVVLSHIRFIKLVLNTNYLFWQVHQPMSQLDIRARKILIRRRAMDANRAGVEQAIREVAFKFEEYEL
ncbi:hypothetical protein KKQ10_13360 [Pseudomonas sp. MG-9]|uniref:Uncharacterized protein n=1 Tax=Pseudomonas serboccidentalis TaxID=2964670 RepID=A0ABY7Z6Y1_9PSED|nr:MULTISPECIES: hypothetical protein [Pseudomonas]MBT9265870.1 hypothetical protein [Pseudomonas sp. MG-9]WDR34787.1 hypothetical protein NN484_20065 [Pseudomonas serboccidentalis]